jgi:hypothetical protein
MDEREQIREELDPERDTEILDGEETRAPSVSSADSSLREGAWVLGGTRDAPVLRSGSAAGVTFLGYLDTPEEMVSGKRRCLYGCDSADDAAYLPTTEGMSLSTGGKTAAPAPWSIALVRGGSTLILGADGTWGEL